MGRLLYDSQQTFEDQIAGIELTSSRRGDEYVDLALLTDGLRAERDQGITIDVAYRYFATPKRKFILSDAPGHVQYTRNMVTGASTANLALILVDARHGVVEQTRRHVSLAALLQIPHLVLCVNKMDLVEFNEELFRRIAREFREFIAKLGIMDVTAIPMSALTGDQVVDRSAQMPWFPGSPLLQHLEEVEIASDYNLNDSRFPVQYVIRPVSPDLPDYRRYARTVAGGIFRPGDAVTVLPSGVNSAIATIDSYDGALEEAFPPMAVTLTLADHVDVSRGDMICRSDDLPLVTQAIDATLCWRTDESALAARTKLRLKHTTRIVQAEVESIRYRLDVIMLSHDEAADALMLNDIGRVRLRTSQPLLVDEYRRNRATGSFILIDPATNNTVGAGMILAAPA